ncbi:MAG TPA: outer membrane protein assembly factor BamB [Steroidobacteraceae bacterium]|nr:outer membrane protein assembly factor BamB [Steroidobacteraceae bacterium]
MRRALLALALVALIAACSKNKDVDRPKQLVPFTAALRVSRVWSASVGGTKKPLRLGLGLAVEGDRVYAAGHSGEVAAFEVATGRRLWSRRTRAALAGGPGADADLVVVGSSAGDVFALRAADGHIRWHVNIAGEVLAAPAVTPRLIVVRAVDGKLHGLSPADGHEVWQVQQPVPSLSLRGTSQPTVVGEVAICGYDNGKVVASNLSDGSSAWETLIAPAKGRTEIERLNDVDATPRIDGNDVYVAQFQGKVAMLALDTGQLWWSHDISSYRGLGIDDSDLFVSTSDGAVLALQRRTGSELWRQDGLLHRGLSAPAVAPDAIVVADYQGYVHWLNRATGAFLARARAGKLRITNAPVAADGLLLVINDAGHITAFRTTPRGSARTAAAHSDRPVTEELARGAGGALE